MATTSNANKSMQKPGPSSRTSDYPLGGTKSFTLKLWRSCCTYGEGWEEDGLWTLRTLPYKYFFPPWLHTTDRQQAHRPWGSKTPEVAIANFDNGEHNLLSRFLKHVTHICRPLPLHTFRTVINFGPDL